MMPKNINNNIPELKQTIQTQEIFSGPLPHPDILKKFKETDPSFPERIMQMTESNVAADIRAKNRISFTNFITPIAGQVFSFLLGVGGIIASVFLGTKGLTTEAIAAIIGGFSPIVISAIANFRNKKHS